MRDDRGLIRKLSIRNVSEAVALVGVVLGLVFVGLEIRTNTAVARAESRRELAEQNIDFLMQVALDDVRAAWPKP